MSDVVLDFIKSSKNSALPVDEFVEKLCPLLEQFGIEKKSTLVIILDQVMDRDFFAHRKFSTNEKIVRIFQAWDVWLQHNPHPDFVAEYKYNFFKTCPRWQDIYQKEEPQKYKHLLNNTNVLHEFLDHNNIESFKIFFNNMIKDHPLPCRWIVDDRDPQDKEWRRFHRRITLEIYKPFRDHVLSVRHKTQYKNSTAQKWAQAVLMEYLAKDEDINSDPQMLSLVKDHQFVIEAINPDILPKPQGLRYMFAHPEKFVVSQNAIHDAIKNVLRHLFNHTNTTQETLLPILWHEASKCHINRVDVLIDICKKFPRQMKRLSGNSEHIDAMISDLSDQEIKVLRQSKLIEELSLHAHSSVVRQEINENIHAKGSKKTNKKM